MQQRHATMLGACLSQAEDLFWLAENAASNTAPILYYYSMLNLAKALIYLDDPDSLKAEAGLLHGLTDPNRIKDPATFSLDQEFLESRGGIFSTLHHLLCGQRIGNRTRLDLPDLLRYCTWLSSEMAEVANAPTKLVECELEIRIDDPPSWTWAVAFLSDSDVRKLFATRSEFSLSCPTFTRRFTRVQSERLGYLQFESKKIPCSRSKVSQRHAHVLMRSDLRPLRLYRHYAHTRSDEVGEYLLPVNRGSSPPLPEPCALLAVAFYLSSIARYQPHVYDALGKTADGWILEAFTRQCPLVYSALMLNHLWRIDHIFITA